MAAQDVSSLINSHHTFFPQKQTAIDNGRINSHPHTVFLSNSRMQHHGIGETKPTEQSKSAYDAEEPMSLTDNAERGKIRARKPLKREGAGSLFTNI
jgi:hypothetical protein